MVAERPEPAERTSCTSSRSPDLIEQLLRRRLLILLGKGGVGKTSVSAAIASLASSRAIRTLAMECDERAPLAAIFGRAASYEPLEIRPGLAVMVLEGRHSLEEYLRLVVPARLVLNAVFSSKLYQYFVQAAPGLRELMMLGKVYYEIERKPDDHARYQLIVLDAPASGQAISLLKMPTAARDTFRDSIVGREAQNINAMLRNPELCAIVQVTTPEALALSETLETHAALDAAGIEIGAVILSRYELSRFTAADIGQLAKQAKKLGLKQVDYVANLAREELKRVAVAREALSLLRKRIHAPTIELPDHRGSSGAALVDTLAADLASRTS